MAEDDLAQRASRERPWRNDSLELDRRLFADPASNYAHWDWIEKHELERYLTRCKHLESLPFLTPQFYENWQNLLKAYEFCDHLRSRYEPMPLPMPLPALLQQPLGVDMFLDAAQLAERPLKQAIREGQAIEVGGSRVLDPQILDTCRACLRDLDACIQLADPERAPLQMSLEQYLRAKNEPETLLCHYLNDYKTTERLDLEL